MENNYIIYGLKEKVSDEIRYIGLTTKTINERFKRHLRDNKIDYKNNWIKKIGKENIEFIIIEDSITCKKLLCEREIFYINKYKNEGHRLTNLTNGGEGFLNTKLSEEHRRNISKNHADVSGEKNPMYGRKHTEEVKQLSRELNTGKVASIETRLKLSEKTKGEKNGNSTLTENDIYLIREYFNDKKFTQVELSLMFNVKQPAIYKIINRLTWKHIK